MRAVRWRDVRGRFFWAVVRMRLESVVSSWVEVSGSWGRVRLAGMEVRVWLMVEGMRVSFWVLILMSVRVRRAVIVAWGLGLFLPL